MSSFTNKTVEKDVLHSVGICDGLSNKVIKIYNKKGMSEQIDDI